MSRPQSKLTMRNVKGKRKHNHKPTQDLITSKVVRVVFDHSKTVELANHKKLVLQRYACLGPGDLVQFPRDNPKRIFVRCKNGLAQICPSYFSLEKVRFGTREIIVMLKEIESQEEFEGFQRLSDFHYRGDVLHGRHIPIIATVDHPFLPKVIGYVEIATSFIMNKPRSRIFNAPFADGNGVSWESWDLQAMRSKTNLIIRIARCVVYPELRGLGLSRLLLGHAFRYATKHWQIARLKPYFIEMTADMLKFLPFAEKSGMHFIGYTEGNLKRLHRDMAYILRNYDRVENGEILDQESTGIIDLQVGYATKLKGILGNGGPNLKSALGLMHFDGNKVNATQYRILHQVLRLPKPTYLKGLNTRAEKFVSQRVKEVGIKNDALNVNISIKPISKPIIISDLTIEVFSHVPQTTKSRAVQEAFGIRPEHLASHAISKLSIEIEPQSTLLIVGPSGSGKTLLLSAIAGKLAEVKRQLGSRIVVTGKVQFPPDMNDGTLSKIKDSKPIIELYGGRDIRRAIYVLNMAGLSEAYLYLKRFSELSAGQQYRAMLARMIDSESNVWLADEFCSTLDPITAHIVAQNLKKMAEEFGATLVVAAPHWDYFIDVLRPDKVVYLMPGGEHRLFSGKDFLRVAGKFGNPKRR